MVIATPPGGMTIPYMMDIVQQSKLYIRPKDHSLVVRIYFSECMLALSYFYLIL